ncbi:glycosyltransferase family 4 protein [Uliginosibacterium paludis]|uniref:Glycosyltransferase family 4 protein n=1 Tax=Uliginosibacterium paludis TaxID=1615952 RepID=A0ABV2CT24_9RHOO
MTTMSSSSKIRTPAPNERIHILEILGNAISGGMENHVLRLIERLPRERFTITALCPFESPWTELLRDQGVEVLVTPMPPDDVPWCSLQLASTLIRNSGVDLLHAHLPNANMLAALAASLTGKPLLTTIHARTLSTQDLEIHRATGNHLAVVCKQTYFQALALGVNGARLSCIPNGVDTQRFRPREESPGRSGLLRQRLGIPDAAPVAGFVGRIHWEKGPDVFVQAALLASQRAPDAHFVLVGDGPMRDGLADLVAEYRRQDRIHFAGLVDDMPSAYQDMDLTVSSSYSEAMPLAVMEAMASGLPVIATRVGGVTEMLEQGETGYLVAPGDAKAIADMLAFLLRSPAEMQRLGARGRQRCVALFELEQSVERTARVITRLLPTTTTQARRVSAAVLSDPPSAG